ATFASCCRWISEARLHPINLAPCRAGCWFLLSGRHRPIQTYAIPGRIARGSVGRIVKEPESWALQTLLDAAATHFVSSLSGIRGIRKESVHIRLDRSGSVGASWHARALPEECWGMELGPVPGDGERIDHQEGPAWCGPASRSGSSGAVARGDHRLLSGRLGHRDSV